MKKYGTEFSVDMVGSYHKTALAHKLDSKEIIEMEKQFPSHIYMITSRPKVSIYSDENMVKDKMVECDFGVNIEGKIKKYKIQLPFMGNLPKLTIKSNYPYNDFKFYIDEKYHCDGNVGFLLDKLLGNKNIKHYVNKELMEHLNLEVLYVGKAYGSDGSRKTIDRLKNHETLQKIISETHYNSPDKEIVIVLWSFEPGFTTVFDGMSGLVNISHEKDYKHMEGFFKNYISEEQRINFAEASLIRYFQPKYNEYLKNNFPSNRHTSYSECYELDINNVTVSISTNKLNLKLYSQAVIPNYNHNMRYYLHSKQDRIDMFDYINR